MGMAEAGVTVEVAIEISRGSPAPKPVEVGKEYDVDITEISRQGDGIARVQGFVIFVKNGKVKQNVKVKVEQVGK
jgi:predicted RNA-binding protein with TRAM domain